MSEIDPIQAQLIAARRNQILDAATRVFAEKGFHKATIRDVAKNAGIADGTIYNYFENKTAVLLGILDRMNQTEERPQHFEAATQVGFEEWTRKYIKERLEIMTPAEPVLRIVISEVLINKELCDLYLKQVIEPSFAVADVYFQRWREMGVLEDIDIVLMSRAIAGMTLGVLFIKLMGETELNSRWDEIADVIAKIVLKGVLIKGDNHE